jgi:hypothetical protein
MEQVQRTTKHTHLIASAGDEHTWELDDWNWDPFALAAAPRDSHAQAAAPCCQALKRRKLPTEVLPALQQEFQQPLQHHHRPPAGSGALSARPASGCCSFSMPWPSQAPTDAWAAHSQHQNQHGQVGDAWMQGMGPGSLQVPSVASNCSQVPPQHSHRPVVTSQPSYAHAYSMPAPGQASGMQLQQQQMEGGVPGMPHQHGMPPSPHPSVLPMPHRMPPPAQASSTLLRPHSVPPQPQPLPSLLDSRPLQMPDGVGMGSEGTDSEGEAEPLQKHNSMGPVSTPATAAGATTAAVTGRTRGAKASAAAAASAATAPTKQAPQQPQATPATYNGRLEDVVTITDTCSDPSQKMVCQVCERVCGKRSMGIRPGHRSRCPANCWALPN